jgi:hypothetical protein
MMLIMSRWVSQPPDSRVPHMRRVEKKGVALILSGGHRKEKATGEWMRGWGFPIPKRLSTTQAHAAVMNLCGL